MNKILEWYTATTGNDTVNAVATKANVNQPTLARQLKQGRIGHRLIVAIARAYDADPIDGLVASGLITAEDLRKRGVRAMITDLTDRELTDEVWRRLVAGTAGPEFTDPLG